MGRTGEEEAARFLIGKGYTLLYRNYRTKLGEIDIICKTGDTIVFVEVRTKRTVRFGTGAESVQWSKQNKIRLVAQHFLAHKGMLDRPIRFDVIDIFLNHEPQITHIMNAF